MHLPSRWAPGAGRVETDGLLAAGDVEYLAGGDVEDFGVGVDELGDQPGAGDPVGLRPGPGYPFHAVSSAAFMLSPLLRTGQARRPARGG